MSLTTSEAPNRAEPLIPRDINELNGEDTGDDGSWPPQHARPLHLMDSTSYSPAHLSDFDDRIVVS